ncbi:MAG: hypothetical protein WBD16_06400 [Pyrinomonadaceae bacterium]
MFRNLIILSLCFSVTFLFGCGGSAPSNSSANAKGNSNANVAEVQLDPANMPPGISANPVIVDAANNAQGANANSKLPKGTPTPGIPSEAELRKPMKPGATPTPGIPSPEELKRMMNQTRPGSEVNAAPPSMMKKNSNTPPMMKSNKVTGGKPQP